MPYVEEDYEFILGQSLHDALREQMTLQGLTVSQVGQSHLYAELSAFGICYARLVVTDIRQFFDPQRNLRKNLRDLALFQDSAEALLDESSSTTHYFLFQTPADIRALPEFEAFRHQVEQEARAGVKVFDDPAALLESVINPFAAWANRAEDTPKLWVRTNTPQPWGAPPPEAAPTGDFRPRPLAEILKEVESYETAEDIKECVSGLVRRILGNTSRLVWRDGLPGLQRDGARYVAPATSMSASEGVILAFCLFLSLEHARRHPKAWLAIRGALDALDTLKYFRAVSCLRDFVIATGASVLIETDNKGRQFMANRLLTQAAAVDSAAREDSCSRGNS